MNRTILIACALIIILGFIAYSNSLNGKFVWDDKVLVRDNVYIKHWSYISKIFAKDIGMHLGAGAGKEFSFYRPLQIFTYMFDYSLWNLNVKGYHLTNIILHILVALAIFWFINILYDNWLLSLFTSLFFVVHPIHTEAVSYISGRADSLAVLFMLLSFIFYLKSLHSRSTILYILMLLSYILALLSRENSLILPLLLLLYHYNFKKRLNTKQFLPLVTLTFIYILLRFTLLKSLLSHIFHSTTFWQRLPGFFVALSNYIKLILLPFNLHMEYGNKLFNLTHPRTILGILILFSLFIYAVRERKAKSLIFFSILWFFITLLPSSNLYPINAYMAEHWLYLPSIGLFLILAKGLGFLYDTKQFKTLTIILTTSLLVFYSYLTIRQNNYWQEPLNFYQTTLKYAPDSPRVYYNLGLVYEDLSKTEEAIAVYKKAIQLNPDYAEAYNNLGAMYGITGKYNEAVALFKKAIQLNPDDAGAYNNLGNVYCILRKIEEAIAVYKKAIQLNPDDAGAYNNLGNVYRILGKTEEAIAVYKKAIQLNPDDAGVYNNLGNVHRDLGKTEEAIALYKKAIELNPSLAKVSHNLSVAYFQKRQYKLAIKYCDKAKELGFVDPALLEALEPYRVEKAKE